MCCMGSMRAGGWTRQRAPRGRVVGAPFPGGAGRFPGIGRKNKLRETREFTPGIAYPPEPEKRVTPEAAEVSHVFLANELAEFKRHLKDLVRQGIDRTNRVDEYRVQTLGDTTTQVIGQPDYETAEIIESIIVTGPTQVALPSAIASGSVLNPAANATIANISAAALAAVAPAGTLWNVSWLAELQGTIGAGDANNMYLSSPLNTIRQQGEFPGVVGVYPQEGIVLAPGAAGINVQANALATVGATYAAEITATPILSGTPFTLKLGKRFWSLIMPASVILVIAPVSFSLSRSDDRILSSLVPGDWDDRIRSS